MRAVLYYKNGGNNADKDSFVLDFDTGANFANKSRRLIC